MTDEFRRERARRAAEVPELAVPAAHGSEAVLGVVTTASTAPLNYFKFQPQVILGTEAEGGGASVVTRAGTHVALFLGPGTLVSGDQVVVRRVAHRWVASKKGGGGGGSHTFPFCPCTTVPDTLYFTDNGDTNLPDGLFGQLMASEQIVYGPPPAAVMGRTNYPWLMYNTSGSWGVSQFGAPYPSGLPNPGWYSVTRFGANTIVHYDFYLWLWCNKSFTPATSHYNIAWVYAVDPPSGSGAIQDPKARYTLTMNSCTPYLSTTGGYGFPYSAATVTQ